MEEGTLFSFSEHGFRCCEEGSFTSSRGIRRHLIGNAVDQKPLEYGEAAGGAVLNVVFQFLPTKFLKQKLNKSMSQSIYTWISLFSTCMMNTNSCIISY